MTKSFVLFPTGASLMFGTTFLIKYGINILQDPLTNGLMNKPVSTSSDVPTDGDIASKYKIHSSLEENESTSFLSSIYSFILDYVSSTSGSINRLTLVLMIVLLGPIILLILIF